jgi:Putative metallopeptidase
MRAQKDTSYRLAKMFAKTSLILAMILVTAFQALGATRHENGVSRHDPYESSVGRAGAYRQDLTEFVVGNMLFVGFHELGHALVGQLTLPVLGRAEAAADSFATLALLENRTPVFPQRTFPDRTRLAAVGSPQPPPGGNARFVRLPRSRPAACR